MKAIYIYLISVTVILGLLLIGDKTFKLTHSKNDVYHLKNYRLNDTVFIDEAVVYIGRNCFGAQEAILLPGLYTKDKYLYIYCRFSPEYFNDVLLKKLKRGYPLYYQPARNELSLVEGFHARNIKKFAHMNDFPTIAPEGFVPVLRVDLPFKDSYSRKGFNKRKS